MSEIALIFRIGAFVISLICVYAITKKPKIQQKKKRKNENVPFGIRAEFIEEAKSERVHRLEQRRKYGIFDENGKRIKD